MSKNMLHLFLKITSLKEKKPADQDMEKEVYDHPSLQLIFDLTVERFKSLVDRWNALDQKASFLLTAATGLVSTGLVLQSLLLPHSHALCTAFIPGVLHSLPLLIKRALPLFPLLCSYLIVMFIGYRAYKTSQIDEVPDPQSLQSYLPEPDSYTKASLLQAMIEIYDQDAYKLERKALLIDQAFVFLLIEAAMLVFLLTYQSIC